MCIDKSAEKTAQTLAKKIAYKLACYAGFAGLGIALVVAGCKNEETAPSNIPNVQLKGTDCLTETPAVIENYLNGRSSDDELRRFWACTQTALTTFKNRVVGSDPTRGYKATELRNFLQANFLGGNGPDAIIINDELLKQFMQLKRLIVGGHQDWITYKEINQSIELFGRFREMTIGLRPHITTLFKSKSEQSPDPEKVAIGLEKFQAVMLELGDIIAKNQVAYTFADLKSFMIEVDKIYRGRGNGDDFARIIEMIPLISSAKNLLFGGFAESIRPSEWKGVFRFGGHLLSAGLRLKLYINKDSVTNAVLLNEVDRLGITFFSILSDAFSYRPDKIIPSADVASVIKEFAKQFDLPLELTAEKTAELWVILVDKIIPEYNYNVAGFSHDELKRLEFIFNEWLEVQMSLIGISRPLLTNGVEEMKSLLSIHPLPVDELKRIIFSNDPNLVWDMETKTRLNLMRAAIGPVVQAFAADSFRRVNKIGLIQKEFEQAYNAIKPFLVLLDIVEEDNTTLGPRIFQEADLFVPRSNGDFVLNFFEVVEYAHLVLAGVDTGKALVTDLQTICVEEANPDPMHSVNAACFRKNYRPLFYHRYSNMPEMVKFFKTLNDKDWAKTLKGMEITNRDDGASDLPVFNSDIYEMGVLGQYIEIIMQRFDVNHDGVLDTKEGLTAFPLFQNVIAEMLGADPKEDEKDVRALFTYMLRYGEPPNPSNPISLLRFLNWKWSESKWKFAADRGIILKILSSLTTK
ncbi:MAG: hypothetical protein AABZ31_06510, partial [Bdellovibrionota bacterium]